MKYSQTKQVWCCKPVNHTSQVDVLIWCAGLFGQHHIDDEKEGNWSWANGEYYGFVITFNEKFIWEDTSTYFSFKNESDAMLFELRWA